MKNSPTHRAVGGEHPGHEAGVVVAERLDRRQLGRVAGDEPEDGGAAEDREREEDQQDPQERPPQAAAP